MNFRDQWVTNEKGERNLFTVEMQRQLSQAGLPITLEAWHNFTQTQQPTNQPSYAERKREPSPPRPRDYPPPQAPENKDFIEPDSIQIDPMSGKYIGRLKWYNPLRGYGFIARGGGEDIFFHKTDTLSDPADMPEGQWILYDVEDTERGLEASDVELYEGEQPQG
ncbi:MAG: cold shock domain-containing protein [Anaerolineae bacterium]|nr:cold shock domain-containing protein [Anaerolineae bacterium]